MIKIIIKNDKIGHGYYVSIVQKTKEACDIIEYFIKRFVDKYSDKNKHKNKFIFKGYKNGQNIKGDKVSIVNFYYEFNIFEM